MRRAPMCILAAVIILTLAGCGHKITSGEVIAKKYTPAYTTVNYIPLFSSSGKTMITTMVPYFYHYPDTYTITIAGYDEGGEQVEETFCVTKAAYEAVAVGDEFVYDPEMEPDQPEYEREPVN